jgi:hypothetical protein
MRSHDGSLRAATSGFAPILAKHGRPRRPTVPRQHARVNKKGSRPTKPARASQWRESQTTHRPSCTDPCVQCPSRALLGSQQHPGETPNGCSECRVTGNAGRVECSDVRTRRRNSGAGSSHTNLSGGSCMHALQKRKSTIKPACHAAGMHRRGTFRLDALAPLWKSYSDRREFQDDSSNDF